MISARHISALVFIVGWSLSLVLDSPAADRYMEFLDRGTAAVQRTDGTIFLGWRWLGNDSAATAFNIYRMTGQDTVRLNEQPIADVTHIADAAEKTNGSRFFVRAVVGQEEGPPAIRCIRLEGRVP